MKFVNIDNFNNAGLQKEPFDYMIIDNFLHEENIEPLLSEFNMLTPEKAYYRGYANEKTKLAFNSNLGELIESVLTELCSEEFISFIEKLFQMNNIIHSNRNLEGAGVHKVYNQGYLTMHTDFNHSKDSTHGLLDRRLNLLLYMNPDWKEDYGGELCLFNQKQGQITKRVIPILNRCVIFNTTDSIHGHPTPMNLPDDKCRQSLALYYYSKNTTGLSISGKEIRHVVWYENIK